MKLGLLADGGDLQAQVHAVKAETNSPVVIPPDSTKYTTLYTLPGGGRAQALVPPYLTEEGSTVLYGKGGRMKGFMALHLALQLVRLQGFRVLVLDYENHPREWRERARAMGFNDNELKLVDYISPYGDYWPWENHQRGHLAKIAKHVREYLDTEGRDSDYVVVDSYTTATSSGDSMGGAPAAMEYFTALQTLGRPSLTLAHVAGGQERFPDKPFGSVFVHNLARETWAVELTGAEGDTEFDSIDGTGQMTIELRNKKSNGGPIQRPQFVKFHFLADGTISVSDAAPDDPPIAEMIVSVLKRAGEALSVKEIVAAIKANEGKKMSEDTARKILNRREGDLFARVTGKKGAQNWAATK